MQIGDLQEWQQQDATIKLRIDKAGYLVIANTDDPGSGFVIPYPRTEPAGGGGGTLGCVDPS